MNAKYGEAKWTLMQDGAPCHTARQTMNWAADNHVCFLPCWPPNSCDLNPIEQIWGIVKHQLGRQRQQSVEYMFTNVVLTAPDPYNSVIPVFTPLVCKSDLIIVSPSKPLETRFRDNTRFPVKYDFFTVI